ncbi:MAG TPA: thioredoxin domain-containing protein [Nitrososphaera sp.]|nr:thioredoxin domain-containing protein [Nitrososphaera sp.]
MSNSVSSNVNTETAQQTNENSPEVNKLSFSSLTIGGSPVRGDPSAPVTIVEFSNFQFPNCGRFARNTAPQIVEEYIETGKANMVCKHFPIRGPDSMAASLASQCTNEQGKFWEFHDLLFNSQEAEGSGWTSPANMKEFASELGLDSERYSSFVENDFAFAREIGATGTPTFVGVKSDGSEPEGILGAPPFSSFKAVLDKKIGL